MYNHEEIQKKVDEYYKDISRIKEVGNGGWWIHKYDLQIKLLILECLNEIASKK